MYLIAFHAFMILLMIYGISTLELRNNDDADLPESDPIVLSNKHFEQVFGNKDRVLISVENKSAYTPAMLEAVRDITNEFVGLSWVVGSEIKSLYTTKNITSTEDGLQVEPLYRDEQITDSGAKDIRRKANGNPLIQGRIVSDDETASLIVINVVRGADQATVYQDTYAILERYKDVGHIRVVGDLVLSEAIDKGIQLDATVLIPIALALQILVMYLVFRNARYVFACVLVNVVSILWTMGIMGLLSYQITVVTTSIPILIAVIVTSYSIYYVRAFVMARSHASDTTSAIVEAHQSVVKALSISSITSAIGAFTLIAFKVSAIADFGVITAIGTVVSALHVLTLLPMLLRTLDRQQNNLPEQSEPGDTIASRFAWLEVALQKWVLFVMQRPRMILAVFAMVIVVASANLFMLRVGANFTDYLPDEHQVKIDMQYFDNQLGGSRYFNIMIEANEEYGVQAPEFLRNVEAIQQYAETLPQVGNTMSFVDIIKRIDATIENKESGSIPDSFDLISQYLLLYSISSSPDDFSEWVDYDYRRIKIFIPVTTSEQEVHQVLYQQLDTFIKTELTKEEKYEFGGNLLVWLAQMDYIVEGKILNIILTLVFVVIICGLFFQSIQNGLVAVVPVIFAVVCTFALMAIIGIRLEVGTAVITAITVGIGVDFAIHFWHGIRLQLEKGMNLENALRITTHAIGMSIIFDILSNAIGFSAFILSSFQPVQTFGYLIVISMLISGIATFTIIPAMVALDRSRKTKNSKTYYGV